MGGKVMAHRRSKLAGLALAGGMGLLPASLGAQSSGAFPPVGQFLSRDGAADVPQLPAGRVVAPERAAAPAEAVGAAVVAASVRADVCVSKFLVAGYGSSGSFQTTCTDREPFTTWVGGSKKLGQEKIARELSQSGFFPAGSYFKGVVLLHINGMDNSTERYCILGRSGQRFGYPAKTFLDCADGALVLLENDSVSSYLALNGYRHFFSHGSRVRVPVDAYDIDADLAVYKRKK